jgi:hypothetical protein
MNPKSNIQNPTSPFSPPCPAGAAKREGGSLPATRHSGSAAIPLPANPVLLSKMLSDPEIRPIIRAHLGHPRLKNAFIRRNSCFSWFLNFS